MGYCAGTDKLCMKLRPVVLSSGARVRTSGLASRDLLVKIQEGRTMITKRMALSFVNGQYDPLGLLAPVSLKLKLRLKQLYRPERKYEWDEPLEESQQQLWRKSLAEAAAMKEVEYLRAVKPPHTKGGAWLVGFGDGSMDAYGAALYARWVVEDPGASERVEVRLILGKSRVTPLTGTTAPRSEAQAGVILSRLMLLVSKSVKFKVERIILASDSEAFIAATEKSSGVLGPYLASRVSEFHLNMEEMREKAFVEPIQHIPGVKNIADLATRGHATYKEVGPGSEWQDGPGFLKLPRERWPLSREFCSEVPPEELRRKVVAVSVARLETGSDRLSRLVEEVMRHATTLGKAEAVIARVCRMLFPAEKEQEQVRERARLDPGARDLKAARHLILLCSMGPSVQALEEGKLLSLGAEYNGGLVKMKGRLSANRLVLLLGAKALPVVQPKTRLAYLIMRQCHEKNHWKGFRAAVAESWHFDWIPRAGNLAKTVVSQCMKCRTDRKIKSSQKMADLPERMIVPTPCFTHVSCDLFGPYLCRGMGNSRVRMKVWGAVFVCEVTRAISVLAVSGYSTEEFLNTYHRFTAIRGDPSTVLSDHGSQLLAAAQKLDPSITRDINWQKIAATSACSGTTWTFSPVGCPWRNPLAERMVGLFKETLLHQLRGNESLNYSQLDTLFAVVARMVNDRPLGVQLLDELDFRPVTCNDLILRRGSGGLLDKVQEESLVDKLYAQDHLVRAWWDEWYQRVFRSLVPYQKWKFSRRNVQEGDVVLVLYPGKIAKGDFRLARVTGVKVDDSGHVRTATVALRPRNKREKALPYRAKALTLMTVAVQRLVVILPAEEQEEQRRRQEEEEARMQEAGLPPLKETLEEEHVPEVEVGAGASPPLGSVQPRRGRAGVASGGQPGFRVLRRLQGLLPGRSLVGALVVGYDSEDD